MKVRLKQAFLHKERGDLVEVAPLRGHLWVKQGIAEYVNKGDAKYASKPAAVEDPLVETAEVIPEVEQVPKPKPKPEPVPEKRVLPKPHKKATKRTWKK